MNSKIKCLCKKSAFNIKFRHESGRFFLGNRSPRRFTPGNLCPYHRSPIFGRSKMHRTTAAEYYSESTEVLHHRHLIASTSFSHPDSSARGHCAHRALAAVDHGPSHQGETGVRSFLAPTQAHEDARGTQGPDACLVRGQPARLYHERGRSRRGQPRSGRAGGPRPWRQTTLGIGAIPPPGGRRFPPLASDVLV